MNAILEQLAKQLEDELKYELFQQGHNASRVLSDSIAVIVNETMTGFEIVGNAAYYAKYVEQGRRPGARGVPIDALIAWLRIKKSVIAGANERSVAFMIQRSIKKKGIEPSLFISKTLERNERHIDDQITLAASRFVDSYIDTMFNQLLA